MPRAAKLCPHCEKRQTTSGSGWCWYCQGQRRKVRNRATIQQIREQPCMDCGLVEPNIMDFDHVPERGLKLFDIGGALEKTTKTKFLAETVKCDVVCPNCHRRRTNARKSSPPSY